ncbi:MAG: Obg family GTPase [Limisphaerales bacterium]
MFVDQVKVYAKAGDGGKGCVAFLREKFRPNGGPCGGNGGRGGKVILRASHDLNNLVDQYYAPRLIAKNGAPGGGKEMDGRSGKDLIVKVPCGTLVWKLAPKAPDPTVPSAESDQGDEKPMMMGSSNRPIIHSATGARAQEIDLSAEEEDTYVPPEETAELIVDLTEDGQEFILCTGGRGGLGNKNFATATRQVPRFAQPGEPGDEGDYRLELRIIAEVGLVGYPNAGKSTLLTAISRARPKVAAYPFTTLHPQIGIVEFDDYTRLTVCDVPGIIEGAHENVGLGHAFLRHIMRCRIIVLLIDMAGTDDRDPWDDYFSLLSELEQYHPSLTSKPRIVVANKVDEPTAEENLKTFKQKTGEANVLQIAAGFDVGLDRFKSAIKEAVAEETAKQSATENE